MAVVVGHGVVPIKPDFGANFHRNIQREGAKATDGLTKQFGGAFKNIAKLAGGIFIGAQVIGQLKSAFSEAAEAQKVGRLTEQVIKTTGGAAKITAKQVGDLSAAISNKTAIDDEAIQSGANLLLTFTKVRNEAGKGNAVFDRTVAVANDMSVALGQDMKSSSLQLGKALNDPIKGVTALSRAGVSFTQQQKDQIKAMQESGDLLGAQKLILKEVETQFGGAAAAVATPVERLKVVWGNLLEELGTRAMPIVEKLAGWLGDMLPGALDLAGKAFGWLGDRLSGVFGWLKNVRETFGFLIDNFKAGTLDAQTFGEIMTLAFGEGTLGFFRGLYDAFFAIIDAGKKLVPVIIDIVKNFTFIGLVVKHFDALKAAAGIVFEFISGTVIPALQQSLGSFVAGLRGEGGAGSFFTDLGEAARGAIRVFNDAVLPAFRQVVGFIQDHLKPILIGLGVVFALLLSPVVLLVGGFIYAYQKFEWFRDGVALFMAAVKLHITTMVDIAVAAFKVIAWVVEHIILPIFDKFQWFIVNVVAPLVAAVFRDIIVPAIELVVSHTQHMWETVQPILQTVIDFVRDKLGPVWEGMRAMAAVAFQALPGLIGAALRLVGGIVAGFLDGVGSIADAIGLDSIAKVLKSGAGSARGWGQAGPATRDLGAGQQQRLATGGKVRGPKHPVDTVPLWATGGEYMVRESEVSKPGMLQHLEAINAGRLRFFAGGLIPDIDLRGLADGVVDKARSIGTAALDRVWPKLPASSGRAFSAGFPGGDFPAGGANYLRDAVLKMIRDKEQAMGSQSGGGFTRAGGGGPAGQYTAGMQRARADILNLFGPMSVGGYSNRNIAGTSTRSQHALHRAWDFMTGQNVPRGNAVSRHLIANASSYGLKGLIWNAQKNFGSGWGPYGHPGGGRSATLQHLDHVHAEFFSKGGKVPYGQYDQGGYLPTGLSIAENRTGSPERVGGAGINIGEVHLNNREDVDEFWRRAEFAAMAGHL